NRAKLAEVQIEAGELGGRRRRKKRRQAVGGRHVGGAVELFLHIEVHAARSGVAEFEGVVVVEDVLHAQGPVDGIGPNLVKGVGGCIGARGQRIRGRRG